ncbi:MAG: N-acetyl-gamma-glutamyl-phosphate reductase, partial [Candidatus Omnitrophota bacterium]
EDTKVYELFYKTKQKDNDNLKVSVYGLPELYREKIKKASLVANPGCYPTAAVLALAPAVAMDIVDISSIIIDAKSGVTGAGRKIDAGFLFSEVNDDFKAYKVGMHQHAPEIDQELSKLAQKKITITFVPHLLPLNRGILETIYAKKLKSEKLKVKNLTELYKKFYKKEPFVRVKEEGAFPRIKDVVGTNFCDIGIKDCGNNVIIISAIDNLLKGASGQAVQNMNIMYGFPESAGLV